MPAMADANSKEAVRPVALTVRLAAPIHELVTEEADRDGISVSQFIREAVLVRCVWRRGRRGEPIIPIDDARALRRLLQDLEQD